LKTPHRVAKTQSRAQKNQVLHAIALFEGFKGLAAVSASLGLLSLTHHDIGALAYAWIGHFHLDPQSHYPRMLMDEALWLQDANIRQVVWMACGYACVRLIEGYGLWRDRTWAEWLAACSGAIYLPIEISHLMGHTSLVNAAVLFFNASIVAYMVGRLWRRKKAQISVL
jgi:uncharacterized membrane protein (DUF2068 family)